MKNLALILAAALLPLAGFSAEKWVEKDYTSWSAVQAQQVLSDSPWAREAGATMIVPQEDPATKDIPLPRPANVPDPGPSYRSDGYGVDDGNWDGGVASRARRGDPPKLPVLVRWDSARPVRQALLKTHDPALIDTALTVVEPDKDYVITVMGLVPGHKPPSATSDDEDHPSIAAPYDPKSIRVELYSSSSLMRSGKASLKPEDVHLDEATGTIQVFFPKTDPITIADKLVVFRATFGKLRVVQEFRLKDMVVKGKLEL